MSSNQYCQSGDINTLYLDHHGWLYGWLWKRLGNSTDAADLAQDVFVRLITKPVSQGFDHQGSARSYLKKMANGMCINLWHRREIEQAWLDTLAEKPEEFAPSAERQAIVLEALQEIGTMLLELPPKAARAFLLAEACQMTDREVAAELGVSDRMVRKYIVQVMLRCMQLQARETANDILDPNFV